MSIGKKWLRDTQGKGTIVELVDGNTKYNKNRQKMSQNYFFRRKKTNLVSMYNLSKQIINAFYHLSYNPGSTNQTLNIVCVSLVTSFFNENQKHSMLHNHLMKSVMASRHQLITIT